MMPIGDSNFLSRVPILLFNSIGAEIVVLEFRTAGLGEALMQSPNGGVELELSASRTSRGCHGLVVGKTTLPCNSAVGLR